jgi:hypothetical protein
MTGTTISTAVKNTASTTTGSQRAARNSLVLFSHVGGEFEDMNTPVSTNAASISTYTQGKKQRQVEVGIRTIRSMTPKLVACCGGLRAKTGDVFRRERR